jgi:hypothetical protein
VEDPHGWESTEDLPDAHEAFTTTNLELRDSPTYAVSRASTLLSLASTPEAAASNGLQAETREILRIPLLTLPETSREFISSTLAEHFGPGEEAAWIMSAPSAERPARVAFDFAARLPDLGELDRARRAELDHVVESQRDFAHRLLSEGADTSGKRRGESDDTARLVAVSLLDPHPLVRVAAAAAAVEMDRGNVVSRGILEEARLRKIDEIAVVAAAAWTARLGNLYRRVEVTSSPHTGGVGSPDAALVHGTWARRKQWWSPGSHFHDFLRDRRVFPNLYSGADPFAWSGFYRFRRLAKGVDWNRLQAASHLAWWAERRLEKRPFLIGHSYGASVSMSATRVEKHVFGLVLLSPAVHESVLPDAAYFGRALVVRMKHDLVLLADRSDIGLLWGYPQVDHKILKRRGLSGHSATHDRDVWDRERLDEFVRDVWIPSI